MGWVRLIVGNKITENQYACQLEIKKDATRKG